jgi:hypothetical protein
MLDHEGKPEGLDEAVRLAKMPKLGMLKSLFAISKDLRRGHERGELTNQEWTSLSDNLAREINLILS